jgi:hypothetical protein
MASVLALSPNTNGVAILMQLRTRNIREDTKLICRCRFDQVLPNLVTSLSIYFLIILKEETKIKITNKQINTGAGRLDKTLLRKRMPERTSSRVTGGAMRAYSYSTLMSCLLCVVFVCCVTEKTV